MDGKRNPVHTVRNHEGERPWPWGIKWRIRQFCHLQTLAVFSGEEAGRFAEEMYDGDTDATSLFDRMTHTIGITSRDNARHLNHID